jgi:hypothetical protein
MREPSELSTLPPEVQELAAEMGAAFDRVDLGHYVLLISGSTSKGTWVPELSDIDFRLHVDRADIPEVSREHPMWRDVITVMDRWTARGIHLDGIGPQSFTFIETMLDQWLSGDITPIPLVWAIWGYHPMPDILNMVPVSGDIAAVRRWKARASTYPGVVQQRVYELYLPTLEYWPDDYHYRNKTRKDDFAFLQGLTTTQLHAIAQVLFAYNRQWFTGDSNLLKNLSRLAVTPPNLIERLESALYPTTDGDFLRRQRETITALARETLALART